jgi:hypothetical protein
MADTAPGTTPGTQPVPEPPGIDTRPPWQRTTDAIIANPVTARTLAAMRGTQ